MEVPKRQHREKSGVEVRGGDIEGQEQLYLFRETNSSTAQIGCVVSLQTGLTILRINMTILREVVHTGC